MEDLAQAVRNDLRWVSIDQASIKSGIAYWRGSALEKTELFKATDKKFSKRLVQIREKITYLITKEDIRFVTIEGIQLEDIEDQSKDISIDTFRKLSMVQGVFVETLEELSIPYDIVHPSVWKSSLGVLKGNGQEKVKRQEQKKRTLEEIKRFYPIDISEDEADAAGIGQYQIQKIPLL